MASSSLSSSVLADNSLDRSVAEKLTPDNFLVWRAVIMLAVRGARLVGYLDGTIQAPSKEDVFENPAYVAWNEKDQQLMSYLLGSISREVLVQLTEHQTSRDVWKDIQDMFFKGIYVYYKHPKIQF
jgi:hypothetical protein